MTDYDSWQTSDKKNTYGKMKDATEGEPELILNGTAIWVMGRKGLSHIFYDPKYS